MERFPSSLQTAPVMSIAPVPTQAACPIKGALSLTPFGLILHSGFFQSFLWQLVCWSLNSNFTKVPAEKIYRQTDKEGQQVIPGCLSPPPNTVT